MVTNCPTRLEHAIEADIFAHIEQLAESASHNVVPASEMLPGDGVLREKYAQWLADFVAGVDFSRLRVLVDGANGAASTIAPLVFKNCGINADFVHLEPNGRNINAGCGALHPDHVAQAVAASHGKYDLGITFDGDADRALFSDAAGKVINGDAVLLLAARDMQAHKKLHGETVVATTMSNMGLEAALKRSGIAMMRAPVGDKYVLEQMLKSGATLGGEQSGHILFRDIDTTTGDGILTALRVLEVMARTGKPLAGLVADMKVFPQEIKNVHVREKRPLEELPLGDGIDPRRRARTRWQRPRRRSLLRHGEAGARDDRSRIRDRHAPPHRRDCQRHSTGDRRVSRNDSWRNRTELAN